LKIFRILQIVLPVAALAALIAMFVYRLQSAPVVASPSAVDVPAPEFALPPLFANAPGLRYEDFKGHVTLVSFFASWCVACRAEPPALHDAAASGIALVGIDYKDKPQAARAFLRELGNPYRAVAQDANGQVGSAFGLYGVPESYLIDKDGVIRLHIAGPLTQEAVREQVVPLAEKLAR
jgi:DsbE subfamily thiol:disulfide oxidoreductase